jgi:hypothetical protein
MIPEPIGGRQGKLSGLGLALAPLASRKRLENNPAAFPQDWGIVVRGRWLLLASMLGWSLASAQSDQQRAQNLSVCLQGRYPVLCQHDWLTARQREKVSAAERAQNLSLCLQGKYPVLCDHGALTDAQRSQVATAERRENLRTCLTGMFPTLCNAALLNPEQLRQTQQAQQRIEAKRQALQRDLQQRSAGARSAATQRAAGASASPLRRGGGDCESGHWVESVTDDGDIVKLEDGSVWEIGGGDQVDTALWLPTTEIVACPDKLINTDDKETAEATRLK